MQIFLCTFFVKLYGKCTYITYRIKDTRYFMIDKFFWNKMFQCSIINSIQFWLIFKLLHIENKTEYIYSPFIMKHPP